MNNPIYIREAKNADLPHIKSIIDDNKMFPSDYIDGMIASYFGPSSDELWYVVENFQHEVVAVAYCAPEQMTEGTWNLLLIAVLKQFQGTGIGGRLVQFVEDSVKKVKGRILLVETSGLPEFTLTRQFYPKCGFKEVAVIPEYYDQGDDKVVFWKFLAH